MTNTPSPTRGRPSKLTPALVDSLAQAVKAGMNRADAAEYAGISAGTFARWLTLGRKVLDAGEGSNEFEVRCASLRLRVGMADENRKASSEPAADPDKIAPGAVTARPLPAGTITSPTADLSSVMQPVITIGKPRRRSLLARVRDRFGAHRTDRR
ncbi:hypothetical protein ABZV61_41790 [Streptomyces sp900116325]|uniref:Uncharacterized protein n=1 Tax=Streptomyces sp. 900116325 TaxID=3154295 RepID=A0ABV2UNU9_9ACTN